jgi:hypothetical protein
MDKDNSSYGKKFFKFDLLPIKSQEEIVVLVDRDQTLTYSFLLIFFAVFLFSVLTLLKSFLVDPNLERVENNIKLLDAQIESFNDVRRLNGELFIKSRALEPILDRDVEVTRVLELESQIVNEFPNLIEVNSYGRSGDGAFAMGFNINTVEQVSQVIEFLRNQSDVISIFLNSVSWREGQNKQALVNITFTLSNTNI